MSKENAAPKKASIKTLHSDPDNARQITAKAQEGLKASTAKFGDLSGIVFNDLSSELVCGHQRVRVLRRAGAKEWVRVSPTEGYIEHPDTGERFKIRIVEWDDVTSRAANLAANNPEIAGTYTDEAIDQLAALEGSFDSYDDLAFGELQASLEKELRKATKELEDGAGAGDQTDEIDGSFAIIIECRNEAQQRELLDRFEAEKLKCRALT